MPSDSARTTAYLDGFQREVEARNAVSEITSWLFDVLMKPHPMLGRKGAVCPYLDQAVKYGRVSLAVIHLDTDDGRQRLRAAAGDWLARIHNAADRDGRYESVLFIPVGADRGALIDAVSRVQQQLRGEATRRGCMVGEFFPGHPMPGIHNPRFRPLDSPRPVLGIRTMVDTDVLFLTMPDEEHVAERRRSLEAWHRFFADDAPRALLDVYRRAEQEWDDERQVEGPG
jgi:hypothetical protein